MHDEQIALEIKAPGVHARPLGTLWLQICEIFTERPPVLNKSQYLGAVACGKQYFQSLVHDTRTTGTWQLPFY